MESSPQECCPVSQLSIIFMSSDLNVLSPPSVLELTSDASRSVPSISAAFDNMLERQHMCAPLPHRTPHACRRRMLAICPWLDGPLIRTPALCARRVLTRAHELSRPPQPTCAGGAGGAQSPASDPAATATRLAGPPNGGGFVAAAPAAASPATSCGGLCGGWPFVTTS